MRARLSLLGGSSLAIFAALLARPAAAEIVDPWRTTLDVLASSADAVVRGRIVEGGGASVRALEVDGVLRLRAGLEAPVDASLSAWVGRGEVREGLAFLARGADGRWRLVGGERGFVVDEAASVAFVEACVRAADAGAPVPARVLIDSLSSDSARIRDDAMRGLAFSSASLAQLEVADRITIRHAALQALRLDDIEPAVRVLGRLPDAECEEGLVLAARGGRAPRLVGGALRGRSHGIEVLLADLAREASDDATRAAILRALGDAGDRRATPAIVRALGAGATRRAAFEALTALRDPAGVPALKTYLRAPALGADLSRAAVALAFTAGDDALGALEFAQENHPDPAARTLVRELLASPAEVRLRVEAERGE